jgi:predicted nucleic acid-binding protein
VTVYLDTSSLVKLYLADEEGGDDVREALATADAAATSLIAYAEARAAFARRRRERKLTKALFTLIKGEFEIDWPHYVVIEPTAGLIREAGDLADRFQLRAFDAMHLASFMHLWRSSDKGDIEFSTFDSRLNRAARSAIRSLKRAR